MKKISAIFGKPIICLVAILLTVVSFILTKTAPAHMYNFPDYRISTRTDLSTYPVSLYPHPVLMHIWNAQITIFT